MQAKDILQDQYIEGKPLENDRAAAMVANMNQILQEEIERISTETANIDKQLAKAAGSAATETASQIAESVATETAPQIAGSVAAETALQAAALEEETSGQEEPSELEVNEDEIAEEVSEMMQTPENMEIPEEDQLQESWTEEEKEDFSQADQEDEMPDVRAQEQSADDYDVITADTIDLGKVVTDQTLAETVEHTVDAESVLPQISEPEDEEDFEAVTSLSEGMEEQICQALTGAARHLKTGKDASTGNMVIQGGSGSGKTVLATAMVKALQKETGRPKGKVGKIEASALNKKDVASLLKKISGGCLIIEKAGDISKETAVRLSLLLKSDTSGLFVIMEDTHRGIEKALGRDEGFASRFSEKVNIPIFTSDELVSFAKAYANELGYTIDEMGILALYNSISNIQKYDRATTLTEVKEIVDDAISKSEKGGLRKAFSIITSRRYDDEDYVILREKDFGI